MIPKIENIDYKISFSSNDYYKKRDTKIECIYLNKKLILNFKSLSVFDYPENIEIEFFIDNYKIMDSTVKFNHNHFLLKFFNNQKRDVASDKVNLINFINLFPIFISDKIFFDFILNNELRLNKTFNISTSHDAELYYIESDSSNLKSIDLQNNRNNYYWSLFRGISAYNLGIYIKNDNSLYREKENYLFRNELLSTVNKEYIKEVSDIDQFTLNILFEFHSFRFKPFISSNKLGFYILLYEKDISYFLYFDSGINKYKMLCQNKSKFKESILEGYDHFERLLTESLIENLQFDSYLLEIFIEKCIKKSYVSPILTRLVSEDLLYSIESKIKINKIINY